LATLITRIDRRSSVSAAPPGLDRTREVEEKAPAHGEPIVRFARSPGKVELELDDLDSLFDRDASPSYPHTRPMLNSTVAKFLVDTVRDDRRSADIEVTVTLRDSPLGPEEEVGIHAKMSSFFANEVAMASLGQRVNRTEAWGSLRFALPVVVLAGLVAGLLTSPSTFGVTAYLAELAYLAVVVVIWVMLWDPIEKLLFDSFFIRLRIRALQKLVAAKFVFVYRPAPSTPVGPDPIGQSPLDSIRNYLSG